MKSTNYKAGFVNIVGKPNVGKSTLMNALMDKKLCIVTSKVQTTRQRIIGILNDENFQIIFSDTPGIIAPMYALQKTMVRAVHASLTDADLLLWMVDVQEELEEVTFDKKFAQCTAPIFLLINKIDLVNEAQLNDAICYWSERVQPTKIIPISGLKKINIDQILTGILAYLPVHPAYYPKDMLTDKPERFFAAEIIREKILLSYRQEIPYHTQIEITAFEENEQIIKLRAEIHVARQSQISILIGKQGKALTKVGTAARKELEKFFNKKVFLQQYVKLTPEWREKPHLLKRFGYIG